MLCEVSDAYVTVFYDGKGFVDSVERYIVGSTEICRLRSIVEENTVAGIYRSSIFLTRQELIGSSLYNVDKRVIGISLTQHDAYISVVVLQGEIFYFQVSAYVLADEAQLKD